MMLKRHFKETEVQDAEAQTEITGEQKQDTDKRQLKDQLREFKIENHSLLAEIEGLKQKARA